MPILEVAIGLVFTFLALSFCATAIAEFVCEVRQWKGRMLHSKLQVVLGPDLVGHFYCERRVADLASGQAKQAPTPPGALQRWFDDRWQWFVTTHRRLIGVWKRIFPGVSSTSVGDAKSLAQRMNARRLPSHIPTDVFSDVLMDWLQGASVPAPLLNAQKANAVSFELADLFDRLNVGVSGSQDALRRQLATWYEQLTERMTGEYKRRVRCVLYAAGVILVLVANADAIRIATVLFSDSGIRSEVSALAEQLIVSCPTGVDECPPETIREVASESETALRHLFGWQIAEPYFGFTWWAIPGWFLTVLAIGLGADFWFGALQRVLSLRRAAVGSESARGSVDLGRASDRSEPTEVTALAIDIASKDVAPLKGFQPMRFSESDHHAFWLAQFSSLAYCTKDEIVSSRVLEVHDLSVKEIDHGANQVFVFRSATHCIVAFRGTEMLPEDWLTDAKAQFLRDPWGIGDETVAVHSGFYGALDLVWEDLQLELAETKTPVWLTGHSLGGALALLCAYRLHLKPNTPTIGGVYTFGQPRIGNAALIARCAPELSQRVFRYVNGSDVVPLVPPSTPLEYEHFGSVRYFDSAGYMHRKRTLWERVSEQLIPGFREIAEGTADWSQVAQRHLKQRIADHAMARYLERVERLASLDSLRSRTISGGEL